MSGCTNDAADEIDRLRAELTHLRARVVELEALVAAIDKQREEFHWALEIIAGKQQCIDNLMSNQDVASTALKGKEE